MIYLKTDEEIELMRISNQIVAKTLAEVCKNIRPGVTTLQLDAIAETFIRDNGATPTFLGYNGFPNTLCVSVNDVVVHGIPSNYALKEGDVVSVDCGAEVNGFHGDSCYTFCVGEVSEEVKALLRTTKESLYKGIESNKNAFSLFFFKKGEEKDAWLIIDCYKQGETAEGEQIIIMGEIINVWMK